MGVTHLKMQFARTASRATASASRAVGGLSTARPASSIAPSALYDSLGAHGIDTYYGVPDSLLKDFCSYVTDTAPEGKHIIAANEGTACGLAAGYHLGTGKIPVVYLQNSGLGNTLNPIMSLMHPKVYSIPMPMMVGWRGEPGVKDEPQHTFMGAFQAEIMDAMKVKWAPLPDNQDDADRMIAEAVEYMNKDKAPFGMTISKGVFDKYKLVSDPCPDVAELTREEAIKLVATGLSPTVCVSPRLACLPESSTSIVWPSTASRARLAVTLCVLATWGTAPPLPWASLTAGLTSRWLRWTATAQW